MNYRKICVIHLNQIGDLVFSLPLLKSLRDRFPGAQIHSVIRPYLQGLLDDSPFVDRTIPRGATMFSRAVLFRTLRRERYDLMVALPRSEEALLLASASGARVKAGFHHWPWDRWLDVKEVIQGHNSWFNNAKLLTRMGVPIAQDNYVGLLSVQNPPDVQGLPWRYVVVSPGASSRRGSKQWNESGYAAVIRDLSMMHGLSCVLVGGADAAGITGRIAEHVRPALQGGVHQVVDLAGKISLRELTVVLKKASLFLGIDSGVMHMASALDVPTVGIFGPTDPSYSGPQNRAGIAVRTGIACSPCYMREECGHRKCLEELEADVVMAACREVLGARS